MASSKSLVTGLLVVVVVVGLVYMIDPTFFGLLRPSLQGFADMPNANGTWFPGESSNSGRLDRRNNMRNPHSVPTNESSSSFFKKLKGEGFEDMNEEEEEVQQEVEQPEEEVGEGFENMASVSSKADFGTAEAPAGCYPRDQLTPSELLPKDSNSVWAEQNPMGPGSLKGKNFLSAGALLGVNTVGQSLRNANWQLRSEPPNPQMPVSIFNQSTIQPDVNRRPLEIN